MTWNKVQLEKKNSDDSKCNRDTIKIQIKIIPNETKKKNPTINQMKQITSSNFLLPIIKVQTWNYKLQSSFFIRSGSKLFFITIKASVVSFLKNFFKSFLTVVN